MKSFKVATAAGLCTLMSSPAFAQLSKGTTMLTTLSTWLSGIAITLVTLALMVVGVRMIFNAAQWKDVAPIFWGGVIIGGAAGIASMLVS